MTAADEVSWVRRASTNDGSLGAAHLGGCGEQPLPSSARSDVGNRVYRSSGGGGPRNGGSSVSSFESNVLRQATSSSCWCVWCCCQSAGRG
eukprot:COSAG02_NODE_43802_length_371_cov_1.147059_1_plen_90_part_01